MSDQFKIETGIQIPINPAAKYPWKEMNVGDSFFVPGKNTNQNGGVACNAAQRLGFKFAVRTVDGGVRVWRIE